MALATFEELANRIKEIAIKECADYPDIASVGPWEQLYAMESSLQGLELATQDLHKVIAYFRKQVGMTEEQMCDLMKDITK